ncbi:hypothetical protein KAR91_54680 [Candidatus Pacearchaeota archaeon]|nr:hypothetical protein [Candidatus Pacearchaeota archaeon]
MTIIYPLTPPADIARGIRFNPQTAVAESTSPFTFEQEIFEHQGQMWRATVQLPPMEQAEAEEWVAFGLALNGRAGTFLFGDPVGETPRGTVSGNILVDGAGQQRSKTLTVKGGTTGQTLLPGDYIELPNNRLHKNLTLQTIDGGGLATLDIFPRVRDVLIDGGTVVTSNTVGIWRIDGDISAWDVREAVIYGINFTAREDI